MTARRNSAWQGLVSQYLREGYGVEDIALFMECDVALIRTEVSILRQEGRLRDIVRPKVKA